MRHYNPKLYSLFQLFVPFCSINVLVQPCSPLQQQQQGAHEKNAALHLPTTTGMLEHAKV